MRQSHVMWGRLVAEVRRAGLRKVVIILVLVAIAAVLAYGNNSTNDAASGRTLPRAAPASAVGVVVTAHRHG
ncbi:MAG: hypothetical protein KGL16_07370 [Acidobacteriota bacterium]|nr:hypothetical protein [Acidobacteriota bacterium]